ncbi:hypothetical protein [Roseivirga sp.]|uniref:hypothetical protein n=1 Tax=Roseivirga sp. TaxID=1964215 RepID=UPI002B273AE5|nr:hypothetical protein [Roseivirga sp.]
MKKLKNIASLAVLMLFLNPIQSNANIKECSWWSNLWGNCEDKAPKDYACYGTITIEVEVQDQSGNASIRYQEVSVMSGNRIDCVVGNTVCREESKC